MKVKFYGVRGSYPVPGKSTIKYGGNTTCVSITKRDPKNLITRLIIDGGTGIIPLGKEIISNFFSKQEEMKLNILFTHHHPDHVQGFNFASPIYFKNAELNLYGMKTLGSTIETVLESQMTPPTFPIEYFNLKSTRKHHIVGDGDELLLPELSYDYGFTVKVMQAYAPSHPQQGALYYRITDNETGKSVACIWDNESKIGGDQAVINFVKGCDVVIHDTQYTPEEYASNKMIVQGFGHSTYDMAVENVQKAEAKKLVCMHYNPTHDDSTLDHIQQYYIEGWPHEAEHHDFPVILAQEGMEIEI